MRPDICVPIVEFTRDGIVEEAKKIAALPVEMAEWRVDFFAGYEREILSVIEELKRVLKDKKLIVTLRTETEGGEPNGGRFDYEALLLNILKQDLTDYLDAEVRQAPETVCRYHREHPGFTKLIGSCHDFQKTPEKQEFEALFDRAEREGYDVGKFACMPETPEDVDRLLAMTADVKERKPDFPIITMSMGEFGKKSRLYGGLYGSSVSFGAREQSSAPGQIAVEDMIPVFDKIYAGKKHIILIGFMGAGKSTIAKELSSRSRRAEIDTDAWIEKSQGQSIPDIFEKEGEAYFRDLETAMIDELGTLKPSIISCGGGMVLREINVRKLQALGEVVLLTAKPETVYERVRGTDNRPLLRGHMSVEYIEKLMGQRMPFYERAATVRVSTDRKMVSAIAKEILEKCC